MLEKLKTILVVFLMNSLFFQPLLVAGEVAGQRGENVKIDNPVIREVSLPVSPEEGGELSLGGVRLSIPAGAVKESLTIRIQELSRSASLDPGLFNVTDGASCYRFLPSMQFEKELTLVMPYDRGRVAGDEVNTFFYNELKGFWQKLKRVGVDPVAGTVTSVTDHFTDMINGTIRLPEAPVPLSFNPNSIKDLEAASPLTGIAALQGVEGDSQGNGSFSLPLTLPPGRNGVAPSLALGYSSGMGNGWLGMGFSLAVPAITIDTRFGLPSYDGNDRYLLNGEELLALPVTGSYRLRRENSFTKVERLGSGAGSYSFIVTTSSGVVYRYGGRGALKSNRGKGEIYVWNLEQVEDANGNTVNYYYREVNSGGGRELYLSEIRYTGVAGGEAGRYRVVFSNESRGDVSIDCRGRFVRRMAERLKNISVYYDLSEIRRYELNYVDVMGRSSLSAVSEYVGSALFYTYNFDWYRGEGSFSAPEVYGSLEQELDRSHSFGGGGSLYAGVGPGIGYSGFRFSGGTNIGFDVDYSFNGVRMLDVNGDGLLDQVIQSNAYNELSVRLNNGHGFDSPISMNRLDAGMDGNLQAGFSLGLSGGALAFSGSVGGSFAWSTGLSRFTDLNGDGYVDFIPQPYGNSYKLGTGSGFQSAALKSSGSVELDGGSGADIAEVRKGFYLTDPVKRWSPYHSGVVRISGEGFKLESGGDGVRLDIFKDGVNLSGATLKSTVERFSHDLTTDLTYENAIYFKVNSVDDIEGDRVEWIPEISYSSINYLDRMRESLNRMPLNIAQDIFSNKISPLMGSDELKLFNSLYRFDSEQKLYIIQREAEESERRLLFPIFESAGLVKGKKAPYGIGERWVSYAPLTKKVYLEELAAATRLDGSLTTDGLLLEQTISEGVVVEERYLVQERGGVKVVTLNPLDQTYVEVDPAIDVAWELSRVGDVTADLILRESGRGREKEYRIIEEELSLFSSIDSLSFESFTTAEQEELLKYYTKSNNDYLVKSLTASEVEAGAQYLKSLGLVSYESVTKSLRLYPEYSFSVTGAVWEPGVIEEPVGRVDVEESLPKEKTGYILLESFDSAGNTILERQYIHTFNSALDFSLESGGATREVELVKSFSKEEFNLNLSRLVDRENEGGSFGDNRSFFSSMYRLVGSRYLLKEEILNESYGQGVTKRERLLEQLYRLGYGNEYFSGGVYGWYYGEWNGDQAFNPDLIGVVDEAKEVTYFTPARALPVDFTLKEQDRGEYYRNRLGSALWLGSEFSYRVREPGASGVVEESERYFASYVTGSTFNPSRRGGDSLKRIPESGGRVNLGEFDYLNRSFTKGINYSASATPLYQTGNFSDTTSQADLFDINGDRYPDRVVQEVGGSLSAILNHRGEGFSGSLNYGQGFGTLRKTNSHMLGFGGKLSPEMISSWVKVKASAKGDEVGFQFDSPQFTGGAGVSGMLGVSGTTIDWADMNGDGLLDQIKRDNSGHFEVLLNLGDEFIPMNWESSGWNASLFQGGGVKAFWQQTDVIRHTTNLSQQYNGSIGVDYASGNVSGGIRGGRTRIDLIDMNGDGLPDQVMKLRNEPFKVKLNLGDRFGEPIEWQTGGEWPGGTRDLFQDLERSISTLASTNGTDGLALPNLSGSVDLANLPLTIEDFNPLVLEDVLSFQAGFNISVGVTGTIPLQWGALPVVFYLSPSGNFAYTMGSSQLMMRDIDGDGLPDHVLKKEGSPYVMVRRNLNGKAGLLKSITNPAKGVTTLDYTRSKSTSEAAGSRWVLSSVSTEDGRGQSYRVGYNYEGGYYDRAERAFYGFSYLKKSNPDGSSLVTTFRNGSYQDRGLVSTVESYDNRGALYSRQHNLYSFDSIEPLAPRVLAARLVESSTTYFDNLSGETLERRATFEYDIYGNLTGSVDGGDPATTADDLYISVDYETLAGSSIHNLPRSLKVTDSTGRFLRGKRAGYDSRGNMTRFEEEYSEGVNPVTTLEYDSQGNLTRITDPAGYSISYRYDSEVKTYVTGVTDSFGYSSSAEYDYLTGANIRSIDQNGEEQRVELDRFRRPLKIFSAYDTTIPAVEYSYDLANLRAVSRNKVSFDPLNAETLDTVVIIDGLGRTIQVKKEGELYDRETKKSLYGWNISGPVVYDSMGRPVEQGQAGFEEGESYNYFAFAMQNPTLTAYDGVGRVKSVTLPDGSTISNSYRIEKGRSVTTVTDPNGRRQSSYRDIRDNIVKLEQWNRGQAITTGYRYDLLGQIEEVKDAKGYLTTVSYDSLGRRTAINNPDSGLTEYRYNSGGQLDSKVTPNLREKNQAIKYSYDKGRLIRVDYPDMGPVTYSYGAAGALYGRAGRVEKVVDDSGSKEYYYGRLGEQIKVIRAINSLNPAITTPYIYTEESKVNYLGQTEWLKYADGEEVSYSYDRGGQVTGVTGSHYGHSFTYIDKIGYDEYGQRNFIRYGNGVETNYTYDPARRWLDRIETASRSGELLQNAGYQFDKVGNILSIEDLGTKKQSRQTYRYDDLYRLIEAEGEFTDKTLQALSQVYSYKQSYSYDEIGNMTRKVSSRKATPRNTNPVLMNYDLSYIYHNRHPHRAVSIGDFSYIYDANGNQTRKKSFTKEDKSGSIDGNILENTTKQFVIDGNIMERYPDGHDPAAAGKIEGNIFDDTKVAKEQETAYHWDSENRLKLIEQGGTKTAYLYDSSGIATVERSASGETLYISELSSIKNEQAFTKHIYVGSTRLASKLGNWGYGSIDLEYEKVNTYYTHGDHLGSATLITDHRGEEYRRYLSSPYGETFVKQGDELDKIDYSFTGQRENESTGLIAFPARYYDPKVSRWLSVDPILGSYLGGRPAGGVFVPANLNLYGYCWGNPVRYVDPSGLFVQNPNEVTQLGIIVVEAGRDGVRVAAQYAQSDGPQIGPGDGYGGVVAVVAGVTLIVGCLIWIGGHVYEVFDNDEESVAPVDNTGSYENQTEEELKTEPQAATDGAGARSGGRWPWTKKSAPNYKDVAGGGCEDWAKKIKASIGGSYLKVYESTGISLGPVHTKSVGEITGWFYHYAVLKDGKVYDLITGSEGMDLEAYKSMFQYEEYLEFEIVDQVE